MYRPRFILGLVVMAALGVVLALPAFCPAANPPTKKPATKKPAPRTLAPVTLRHHVTTPTTGIKSQPQKKASRTYHLYVRMSQGGSKRFKTKSEAQAFSNSLRQAHVSRSMRQVGKVWEVRYRSSSGWRHVGASRNLRSINTAAGNLRRRGFLTRVVSHRS